MLDLGHSNTYACSIYVHVDKEETDIYAWLH